MSFSIHYRSTDSMHPARAYEIKQHAEALARGYGWFSCEPVSLQQQSDGYLSGRSAPNFFPAEIDAEAEHDDGLPDGTVLSLAEVLCELSRVYDISWDIGHDYESLPIGRISDGIADSDLIEQLETFGSIGDLLDDLERYEDSEIEIQNRGLGILHDAKDDDSLDDDPLDGHSLDGHSLDDEEPRVIKFPGIN